MIKKLLNEIKQNKAVTLVSLVITVIILLILATVSIMIFIKKDGLINKTEIASEQTKRSQATETMNLKITNIEMSAYIEEQKLPSLQYVADKLCEDNDIDYVTKESKTIASLDKIILTNEDTSIYTKLKDYPYEFEINRSLQLASIDGVKIANDDDTVTLSKEEYNNLVKRMETLENKNNSLEQRMETLENSNLQNINMSAPIDLTCANLANTNSEIRNAGAYQASSNSFTKTNSEEMSSYLDYKEGVGWTVLKSGWYYFSVMLDGEVGVDGQVASFLKINNKMLYLTNAWVNGYSPLGYATAHSTLFLNVGDVIDFSYEISTNKTYSWARLYIYALFK